MTIRQAMYIYSPPIENNTERHIACIEQYSGINANVKILSLR